MTPERRRLSVDLGVGDSLTFEDGRIVLTIEEKSGRRARLKVEMVEHLKVERKPRVQAPESRVET